METCGSFKYACMLFLWQQIKEFCEYAHAAKPTGDTPRIEECIQLFNGLTIWVVCSILKEYSAFKRADIIEKFIESTKVGCSECGLQRLQAFTSHECHLSHFTCSTYTHTRTHTHTHCSIFLSSTATILC